MRRLVPLEADTLGLLLSGVDYIVVPTMLGARVPARVRWSFEPLPGATGVELALELHQPSASLRAFLRLGGRRRLERRLADVLAGLAEVALLAA